MEVRQLERDADQTDEIQENLSEGITIGGDY
jgi:hypothetical protein